MDDTKLYLCFEATNTNAESVYLIYSANVSDLRRNAPNYIPKFTFENSISGASSMGCGLFHSKIVLAGGVSGAGEETEYNRGLVTYDPVSKKVSREDIPDMRGLKVRPLVFELYGRLYVLDTRNSLYKRKFEVYYPSPKVWEKVIFFNAFTGNKNVSSGRTPYTWFINGMNVFICLPTCSFTYIHRARPLPKFFIIESTQPLPFQGMATTYWLPDFYDVVVISFSEGGLPGQGHVEGRRLRYSPISFSKPELIFLTDAYRNPDGKVSSYFAECENGRFCLTTFDNVNIHVYVFKVSRHEGEDGATSLDLDELFTHKYNFNDFSREGITSVSISGCFVLPREPRDDGTKRSEESKLCDNYFLSESDVTDDDLPILVETAEGFKIDPEYESGDDEYDSGVWYDSGCEAGDF